MMERWEHSLFKTLLTFCRISEITHRVGSGQWCSSHHSWGNGYDHEIVLHPITDLATLLGILFFFAYGETKHNKKPMTKMMRCWTSVFALEKRLTQGSFNNRKVRFFWPLKKKTRFSLSFPWFLQRFSSVFHPVAMETDGATDGAMAGALSPASDLPKAPPARKAVAIPTWKLEGQLSRKQLKQLLYICI
jgi:hypothetical protein